MVSRESTRTKPAAAESIADDGQPQAAEPQRQGDYVVVARRYRPQTFTELIGQEHVARALSNAIRTNRVGHAYLFTGARGVGKTSAARILAKSLDCIHGPTPTPCNECDICQSISAGSDVDVLEIDGASNRGIDEIRQLRQNVNIRPSRARFKIYIIDEVHMLTKEAFNALLKTLEEPPEHVKFIFCTTEASKIPITILSRCQRFDFAGIRAPSIAERLAQIVAAEGVQADSAALDLLSRRANGSMRDSQSLLEQLLSFGGKQITTVDVHAMLGTAGDVRMTQLVAHLIEHNAAAALTELDQALVEGVDVGQLVEQLLGYFRDCMAAAVGCSADSLIYTPGDRLEQIVQAGRQLGLETILAVIQILDQTLSRLRYSTQGRTLAETALVRICSLGDLTALSAMLADLQAGVEPAASPRASSPPPAAAQQTKPSDAPAKKKAELAPAQVQPAAHSEPDETPASEPVTSPTRLPLTEATAMEVWRQALAALAGDMIAESADKASTAVLVAANSGPARLVVSFPERYNFNKSYCERPDQLATLERALAEVAGQGVKLEFALVKDEQSKASAAAQPRRPVSQRQLISEKSEHPLVRRAMELFDAHPHKVD